MVLPRGLLELERQPERRRVPTAAVPRPEPTLRGEIEREREIGAARRRETRAERRKKGVRQSHGKGKGCGLMAVVIGAGEWGTLSTQV